MFSTNLRPPLVRLCYPSPLVLRSPNTFDSTEGWPKDLDDETYIDPPEGVGSNTGLSQQYSGPELRASSVGLGNEHYQSQGMLCVSLMSSQCLHERRMAAKAFRAVELATHRSNKSASTARQKL